MAHHTSLHTALEAETDKLLGCIHCGLCLPACPTYQQAGNENDSPRGRIYLMRAVAENRLDLQAPAFTRHIDLCLGCRACETACPAGVQYGHLLEAARATLLEEKTTGRGGLHKRLLKLALRHVFPNPTRLAKVFRFARALRGNVLIKWAYHNRLLRRLSPKADFALSLLMTTSPALNKAAATNGQPAAAAPPPPQALRPVAIFTGCVMEGLFQHVNEATARVLTANSCRTVAVPAQVCCGALHAHSGDLETARKLARRNIRAFGRFLQMRQHVPYPPTIIINAAGCGALLKEYGELLKDDPLYAPYAQAFSECVKDATEFLAQGPLRRGALLNERVTLDAPCHLYHAQRVMTAPQQVLAAIPGLDFRLLEGMQDCCGGAGIYNLSEPEMSNAVLADKMAKVKATGARVLLTANPGCHMQLGAGARLFDADCRVAHVVELLDESYRRAGYYQASNTKES